MERAWSCSSPQSCCWIANSSEPCRNIPLPSAGLNSTWAQFCTCWGLLWGGGSVAWSLEMWSLTLISYFFNNLWCPCSLHVSVVGFAILTALPVSPFVALPAADSDESLITALPGSRPVLHNLCPQLCPTASLPVSVHIASCAALFRSSALPPFFKPYVFHSSVIWPPAWAAGDLSTGPELLLRWFHQYLLPLSSVPPFGSELTLLCVKTNN